VYVKICGLSEPETLQVALDAGADAVGFVLSPASVRNVDPAVAAVLVATVGGAADTVLVVSHASPGDALRLAAEIGVDVIQLHGRYTADDVATVRAAFPRVWRAASVGDGTPVEVGAWGEDLLLLDSPVAGSGERWDASDVAVAGRWMLAGGLNPGNVAAAIATSRPWGVDVSSGVESAPGRKDPELIRAFVAAARG
jgi:phosphoribosylanthranilate isomerase